MIEKRRRRGNDGASYTTTRAVSLRQSLVFAVCPPEPLVRAAPKIYYGPKPRRGGPAGKLTDAQFLQVRSLHHFSSMTKPAIAEALGLTLADVENVLKYHTRANIDPDEKTVLAFLAARSKD